LGVLGVYVFVLAHLAAGIRDNATPLGFAGARVDDHQRIAEAAAMGAIAVIRRHLRISSA
jgi:hypothetical protein